MRDDQVFRMQEINVKRSMILLRQYEFLTSRFEAFEWFLRLPFYTKVKAMFRPQYMFRLIDNKQREIMSAMNKQMDEAMAKPVVKKIITNGAH